MRVHADGNVARIAGSALAVETLLLAADEPLRCAGGDADTILLVKPVAPEPDEAGAMLVLAGEELDVPRLDRPRTVLRAEIGAEVDLHAPLGPRERIVAVDRAQDEGATGKRSFQVLFGPHNGSTRATMFVGYVPPGTAPWHFHLYDEIVWIWRGEGRFHTRESVEALAPGCAFRIRPREVHIVENTSPTDELVVVGLFTPAGSPSAAYLAEPPA